MLHWFRNLQAAPQPCAHEAEIEMLHRTIAEYREKLAYYESLHPEVVKMRNLILEAHDLAGQTMSRAWDASEQASKVQQLLGLDAESMAAKLVEKAE